MAEGPASIPEGEQAVSPAELGAELGAGPDDGVVRNLNGQKLGRKGRDTRQRIINAAADIVADPSAGPVSLSAVARRVSLGMTSLYLYFNDLTELLLAVFEPAMAEAEEAFVWRLRERWPDADLGACCRNFIADYFAFWQRHSRILHLRNALADTHDRKMMEHRIAFATPIIAMLVRQMDQEPAGGDIQAVSMASMLMTGIERSATIWSDKELPNFIDGLDLGNTDRFRLPAARLLELGIRDGREAAKPARATAA